MLNSNTKHDHHDEDGFNGNSFLEDVPFSVWERLAPHLQSTPLALGTVLHEVNQPLDRIYFPDSGLISLTHSSQEGTTVEVAVIGRSSFSGGLEAITSTTSLVRASVQIAGQARWIPAAVFAEEFHRDATFRNLALARYEVILAQTSQAALCNRVHSIEQRLCRWLLMVRDHIGNENLALTHEFLSQMLGVQRPGVSLAVSDLRENELISTIRGVITILNPEGLEARACECYSILRDRCAAILPDS